MGDYRRAGDSQANEPQPQQRMEQSTRANRRTALKAIGAGIAGGATLSGTAAARGGGLQQELAEVRSATAEYNDSANAIEDGYAAEEHAVCGMGYHYPNFGLLGTVDRTEPQVLVYGEDDDGNLILGAVEYVVPKAGPYAQESPDFFEHDGGDEQWASFGPNFWALHLWVHTHNPDGVFSPTNPRDQFCPEGAGSH